MQVHWEKAFLLHLLKRHDYVCPHNDSNLNKEVQTESKRWLAEQITQKPAANDAWYCYAFHPDESRPFFIPAAHFVDVFAWNPLNWN